MVNGRKKRKKDLTGCEAAVRVGRTGNLTLTGSAKLLSESAERGI